MSPQAEVERERRARVITADGEFQTAQQLACASRIMADTSEVMQLRLFRTVVEVAAEKHSTLVMPFLWNCCGYFDRAARRAGTGSDVATLVPAPHDETVPTPRTSRRQGSVRVRCPGVRDSPTHRDRRRPWAFHEVRT
ncbi:hypothetical protein ACFYXW_23975 [Streptomyces sp. NPDC001981]|uniref:hypothetical protein n=1 Tax=Streptomyces sp. NPDC001981 TaxID=3364628 RepID=UPI0036B9E896